MYHNRYKQFYFFFNPVSIFLFLLSNFFVSSLSAKSCYSKAKPLKASYNELRPDKFMTTWKLLDPIPVFESKQGLQNMELQEKIFHSDSLSNSKVLASVQRGIQ